MDRIADILDVARGLSRDERRRLIIALDSLEAQEVPRDLEKPRAYSALRRLQGTVHSDFTDLSTNKYEHVAASIAKHKDR